MSTNWFHDLFFGSNESSIEALEKLQNMDAERFQAAFSRLDVLEAAQKINADQLQTAFSRLEELQKSQQIDAGKFESMQTYLDSLQERLADVEEKVETLTETVANQEKVMLTCCIVASVVAMAAIGFIGFCIYQGIKSEREKQKGLSDTSGKKLNNDLGQSTAPDTKLDTGDKPNNLQVNGPQADGLLAANL